MSEQTGLMVIVCSKCFNPMFSVLGNNEYRWYCPTCKVFRTEESSLAHDFEDRKDDGILCCCCRKKEAREYGLCLDCKLAADQDAMLNLMRREK